MQPRATMAVLSPRHIFMLLVLLAPSLCARPPPSQRKFVSPAVDDVISDIKSRMKDPALATMFENCLPNTLDTTVRTSATVSSNGQRIDYHLRAGSVFHIGCEWATGQLHHHRRHRRNVAQGQHQSGMHLPCIPRGPFAP